MVKARDRGRRLGTQSPEAGAILAVARSLRLTLACVLEGHDPRRIGKQGFTAVGCVHGSPLVRFGTRVLPGVGSYLQHLLREAGVELQPH